MQVYPNSDTSCQVSANHLYSDRHPTTDKIFIYRQEMVSLLTLVRCAGTLHRPPVCPSETVLFTQNAGDSFVPLNHRWFPEGVRGSRQYLRKGKNGGMILQICTIWVLFPSLPNSSSSSCSISGKMQTISGGIIRHLILSRELGGVALPSMCSLQAAPAAILSHWSPSTRQFRAAQWDSLFLRH